MYSTYPLVVIDQEALYCFFSSLLALIDGNIQVGSGARAALRAIERSCRALIIQLRTSSIFASSAIEHPASFEDLRFKRSRYAAIALGFITGFNQHIHCHCQASQAVVGAHSPPS